MHHDLRYGVEQLMHPKMLLDEGVCKIGWMTVALISHNHFILHLHQIPCPLPTTDAQWTLFTYYTRKSMRVGNVLWLWRLALHNRRAWSIFGALRIHHGASWTHNSMWTILLPRLANISFVATHINSFTFHKPPATSYVRMKMIKIVKNRPTMKCKHIKPKVVRKDQTRRPRKTPAYITISLMSWLNNNK